MEDLKILLEVTLPFIVAGLVISVISALTVCYLSKDNKEENYE